MSSLGSALSQYLHHLQSLSSLDTIVLGLVSCVLFAVLSQVLGALGRNAKHLSEKGAEKALDGLEKAHPVTLTSVVFVPISAAATVLPVLPIYWFWRNLQRSIAHHDWGDALALLAMDVFFLFVAFLSARDCYHWGAGHYVGSRKSDYEGHALKPELQKRVEEWRAKED